ncbi:VOC family protein [Veronia nyctiphanis]|nr:VOC family protein [Veronia nyctiphanis]
MSFVIKGYEHVGIRVSDRAEALTFYAKLGFRLDVELPEHQAVELVSEKGVMLNLIFNAQPNSPKQFNILQDNKVKLPGITHVAFIIDSMAAFERGCRDASITITEGPIKIGGRRLACFIRDPDGNVLEFNQYL